VLVCSKADILLGAGLVRDEGLVESLEVELRQRFSVLCDYMENNAQWVDVIPFSALAFRPDQERLGVTRLLDAVLPRQSRRQRRHRGEQGLRGGGF